MDEKGNELKMIYSMQSKVAKSNIKYKKAKIQIKYQNWIAG